MSLRRNMSTAQLAQDHDRVLYGADDTDTDGLIDRVGEVEKTHEYVQDIRNHMRQIVWGVILLVISTFALDWYKGARGPSVEEISQAVATKLKEAK